MTLALLAVDIVFLELLRLAELVQALGQCRPVQLVRPLRVARRRVDAIQLGIGDHLNIF